MNTSARVTFGELVFHLTIRELPLRRLELLQSSLKLDPLRNHRAVSRVPAVSQLPSAWRRRTSRMVVLMGLQVCHPPTLPEKQGPNH